MVKRLQQNLVPTAALLGMLLPACVDGERDADAQETPDVGDDTGAGSAPDSSGPDSTGPDSGSPNGTDAGAVGTPGFLDDVGDGWLSLIQGEWRIEPHTETYRCVRFTAPRDVYLSEFRALSPPGTHHTLLTVGEAGDQPDGISDCVASTNASVMISGSGVGTPDFVMPEGVAVHIRQGQQLLLNLHLYNVSDEPMEGVSGTLVRTLDASEVDHVSDGMFAGPVILDIPVGRSVQRGKCTVQRDMTLFGVGPHMHQLGVHLKSVVHSSVDGEVVLHDGPYDFEEQVIRRIDPVELRQGDEIHVECTYENTTNARVRFGDSSEDEMCFVGLLRYPAADQRELFVCFN